jgi:cell fate regulator YaaT (PSP1 superfamily)
MKVTGVKFRERGKIYVFRCDEMDLRVNEWVMVETDRGLAVSCVAVEAWDADHQDVPGDLKRVVRRATKADLESAQARRDQERRAREACLELIAQNQLPMKLVEVESVQDGGKLMFFFTAENRVDFRKLVKELARRFHCKVEMRQIGVRNEAKMLGGLGNCGRELCCATFLNNFEPVSVRMAKDQNLSLNPLKISGLCGRLMCCLAYEHAMYMDLKKRFPACRKWVSTTRGVGRVKRLNVLADKVVLEIGDGQETEVDLADVREVLPGKPDAPAGSPKRG